MGVQFFGGMFYKCVDVSGTAFSASVVPNKNACIALNHQWVNSNINFDNAINGFLALLQVVRFIRYCLLIIVAISFYKSSKHN